VAKSERQQKLCLHLLAIQREQENLGRPRCSACLQVKALNQQWWNNGWPADLSYAVAILGGEEGYLKEGVDFKPNQSAATEAKTGGIRTQWGVEQILRASLGSDHVNPIILPPPLVACASAG
jgi:hypothetical protein